MRVDGLEECLELLVGERLIAFLASAEGKDDVDGVAGGHEAVQPFRLHLQVVVRDASADLDLLDLEVLLRDTLFFQPLALLVAVFVEIHDPRDGRLRKRGYFDQVQILGVGPGERVFELQHAEVRSVFVQNAQFGRFDFPIDSGLIDRIYGVRVTGFFLCVNALNRLRPSLSFWG